MALYCRHLLDAADREQPDRILLLGDLLYHGPRNDLPGGYAPKEVISLLNDRRAQLFCVRGNCEAEVDQMVLTFPVLADYCLVELDGHLVFATHGHHASEAAPPPCSLATCCYAGIRISPPAAPVVSWST